MTRRTLIVGGIAALCVAGIGITRLWGTGASRDAVTGPVAASEASAAEAAPRDIVPGGSTPTAAEARRREVAGEAPVPEEIPVAAVSLEPQRQPSSRELWSAATLNASMIYDGTLEAESVVDLALLFLEGADFAEPEWDPDGSVMLALGGDSELGGAALHVYPQREAGEREFVLELDMVEAPTYVGPPDSFLSSKAEFSFGFPGGELNCQAHAYSQPVPSPGLYDHLADVGSQSVGGQAVFSPQSVSWKEMTLTRRVQPDGTFGMAQFFGDPRDRYANSVSPEKVTRLKSALMQLQRRRP